MTFGTALLYNESEPCSSFNRTLYTATIAIKIRWMWPNWHSTIPYAKAELHSIRNTLQTASDFAYVFYTWHAVTVVPKTCYSLHGRCNFAKRMQAWYISSSCECGSVFNKHCVNNNIFAVNFPSSSLMIETADSSATSIISTTYFKSQTRRPQAASSLP